jgi:hypothetical protein
MSPNTEFYGHRPEKTKEAFIEDDAPPIGEENYTGSSIPSV